jgi:hypothetical protein
MPATAMPRFIVLSPRSVCSKCEIKSRAYLHVLPACESTRRSGISRLTLPRSRQVAQKKGAKAACPKIVSVSNAPRANTITVNKDQLLRLEHQHIYTTNVQMNDESFPSSQSGAMSYRGTLTISVVMASAIK